MKLQHLRAFRKLELSETIERSIGVALSTGSLRAPSVRAFLRVVRNFYPNCEVPALGQPVGTVPSAAPA